MKNILIIYPNWLPSNAVGVQRVRLLINFFEEFDLKPFILAVDPQYYEEETSEDLKQLVRKDIHIEYVAAKKANQKFRVFGDIALRAFKNLEKRAIEICKEQKIDFIWSPIPPFYTSLITRKVHDKTGIPYGVDYIDPWVHLFPGGKKIFSKPWAAGQLSKILEPIAIKKASLISGVSAAYFLPVLERNPHLKNIEQCSMPYGFDIKDYDAKPIDKTLMWSNEVDVKPLIYAGAFLPKSHYFIEKFFEIIAEKRKNNTWDEKVKLYFVGTGKSPLNSIAYYAEKYGISDIVTENQERISYLRVLYHLSNAYGVMAVGSTEKHYTASKIFQALFSNKKVFGIFHEESSVVEILNQANADDYLVTYKPDQDEVSFKKQLQEKLELYLDGKKEWKPDFAPLEQYSARAATKKLADSIKTVLNETK